MALTGTQKAQIFNEVHWNAKFSSWHRPPSEAEEDRIQPPANFLTTATLASALGHLGETDDARAALEQVYELRPDFSGPLIGRLFRFRNETERARFLDGLRKAGLPE